MSDDAFERLQRYASEQAKKEKQSRLCCGNCAWFCTPKGRLSTDNADGARVGRCMRYPPTSGGLALEEIGTADGSNALLDLQPCVVESWVCGECMHVRTGETPYGDAMRTLMALRHRVGDLQDQIDRMKCEGDE